MSEATRMYYKYNIPKEVYDKIQELEQQKAELIEDLKFIAEQEDAQYINDILKKHGVEI